MTELHLHIFLALGVLIMLAEPVAVGMGLLVVLVHHAAFFFLLPGSLINYQAGFGILVIHANFFLFIKVLTIFIYKKLKITSSDAK